MNEIWAYIENTENRFMISSYGRVKAIFPYRDKKEGRILKSYRSNTGYYRVSIPIKKKNKLLLVHRLVAQAFIINPHNKPCVNHIDNNPSNNHANNLEWCTHQENTNHSKKQNRLKKVEKNRKDLSQAILQYTLDGIFISEYPSANEAARAINGRACLISTCANGGQLDKRTGKFVKTYKACGYLWKWKKNYEYKIVNKRKISIK